ncbi:hypothetical protein SDC9_155119 [bioreactor metagenome]|uniref:Uncharacterized protein n=1 Tax=bioreactor metagenome TaxID=1076179 RepID=A0A645F0X4_9ZZZZ
MCDGSNSNFIRESRVSPRKFQSLRSEFFQNDILVSKKGRCLLFPLLCSLGIHIPTLQHLLGGGGDKTVLILGQFQEWEQIIGGNVENGFGYCVPDIPFFIIDEFNQAFQRWRIAIVVFKICLQVFDLGKSVRPARLCVVFHVCLSGHNALCAF